MTGPSIAILSGMLVIFTAMLEPKVSASIAAMLLAAVGTWKALRARAISAQTRGCGSPAR